MIKSVTGDRASQCKSGIRCYINFGAFVKATTARDDRALSADRSADSRSSLLVRLDRFCTRY